jgi:2-dehydropantoate 2-reductase
VIGPSPQSERVAAALTAAAIPTHVSADVAAALWEKLVINCAYNALSAIVPINYGALVATPGARAVMRDAIAECVAVARASGVTIGADPEAMVFGVAEAMPAQYSSTAQDLAANKPSEIDHLNGYVVRRGEVLGVPTPVNRTLWTLVRALEQKRRGPPA